MSDQSPPQSPQPIFDPNAEHQQKPKLRKVRGMPVPVNGPDGKQMVMIGITDAQQVSSKMIVTHPAFQGVLPLMDGSRDIDQIIAEVGKGLERPMLEQLIAQLDDAGLVFGPNYEAMLAQMHADFDEADLLPPGVSAQFAEHLVPQQDGVEMSTEDRRAKAPDALRSAMDQWIEAALKDAENPSFDTLPKAIVAPHVDYIRGWMNYANVYGRMRVVDRPDRIIILGTNHFGMASGVCGCDKGYESPLGVCEVDTDVIDALKTALGTENAAKLFENRYDHENEHSIELHIPWIQHIFGFDDAGKAPKVFGALIHDPVVNEGKSYDGKGLDLDPFVEALTKVLDTLPGTTLVISSADLSHAGPAFGDPESLAGDTPEDNERRAKIAAHDQEMLALVVERRMDDLIGSMSWQQNPTRWCSVGNLTATVRAVNPERVELLNYAAAMDPQGTTLVSSAAMAMY
ncbi:MAG: AmmeMemoRadiSam system protein B [Phycisphaerales bacterium]|nr:AmmeMemoRadiSam system protein B [Phycisphaerales bacterium]